MEQQMSTKPCWRGLNPEQPGPGVRLCNTAGVPFQTGEVVGIPVVPVVRLSLRSHRTTGTRCRQFLVSKVVPIEKGGKYLIPTYHCEIEIE